MKKSILTFLILIILLCGMSSNASDGMTMIINELEYQPVAVIKNPIQTKESTFPGVLPDPAVLILIPTGLIGLAGLSRNNYM